ncbi:hypothetical protein VTN77DRAFT_8782 [Rasamsonia byssochlamydoides]|uniref:uncharacterized protein n=1 Tax=Rasamsonia byssochlamydoides TaxID=89139 RepID=UPI003741EFC1
MVAPARLAWSCERAAIVRGRRRLVRAARQVPSPQSANALARNGSNDLFARSSANPGAFLPAIGAVSCMRDSSVAPPRELPRIAP